MSNDSNPQLPNLESNERLLPELRPTLEQIIRYRTLRQSSYHPHPQWTSTGQVLDFMAQFIEEDEGIAATHKRISEEYADMVRLKREGAPLAVESTLDALAVGDTPPRVVRVESGGKEKFFKLVHPRIVTLSTAEGSEVLDLDSGSEAVIAKIRSLGVNEMRDYIDQTRARYIEFDARENVWNREMSGMARDVMNNYLKAEEAKLRSTLEEALFRQEDLDELRTLASSYAKREDLTKPYADMDVNWELRFETEMGGQSYDIRVLLSPEYGFEGAIGIKAHDGGLNSHLRLGKLFLRDHQLNGRTQLEAVRESVVGAAVENAYGVNLPETSPMPQMGLSAYQTASFSPGLSSEELEGLPSSDPARYLFHSIQGRMAFVKHILMEANNQTGPLRTESAPAKELGAVMSAVTEDQEALDL